MAGKQSPTADGAVAGAGGNAVGRPEPERDNTPYHEAPPPFARAKLFASARAKAAAAARELREPSEQPTRSIRSGTSARLASEAIIALFRAKWPAAFATCPRTHPLAIGIHRPIIEALAAEASVHEVAHALRRWVGRDAYLRGLAEGLSRVNLAGAEESAPTEDHRLAAAEKLARRQARRAAR